MVGPALVSCFFYVLIAVNSALIYREEQQATLPSVANLGPVYHGFSTVFAVRSQFLEPDLSQLLDFRTSQRVLFQGQSFASRKVLYTSTFSPKVVLLVALDVQERPDRLAKLLSERREYCRLHNYGMYARYIQDFAVDHKPAWEALGLANFRFMRQAMQAFPHSEWFWLFSAAGELRGQPKPLFFTKPELLQNSLEAEFTFHPPSEGERGKDHNEHPAAKGQHITLMNFASKADNAALVVTSNLKDGLLSSDSMAVRQSLAGKVMLEMLTDPIIEERDSMRRAPDHAGAALIHLARWHPQLSRSIALVAPERLGVASCTDFRGTELGCMHR